MKVISSLEDAKSFIKDYKSERKISSKRMIQENLDLVINQNLLEEEGQIGLQMK